MTANKLRTPKRKKNCRYCGETFYANRSDAQFCTASCRQKNHLEIKINGDYLAIVKAKLLSEKTNDQKEKSDLLRIVHSNLVEVNDPKKYKKFDTLLAEQRKLVHANESIADFFALEQKTSIKQSGVTKLQHKIDKELAALNEKHSLKYGFLIEAYEMMQEYLDYLTSEYELTRKTALKITFPEDLRTNLIKVHAKLKKVAVYP